MIVKVQQRPERGASRCRQGLMRQELLRGQPDLWGLTPNKAWLEKADTKPDLSGDECLTQERNASLSGRTLVVLSPFLVTLMVDVVGGKGFGYLGLDVGASGRLRGQWLAAEVLSVPSSMLILCRSLPCVTSLFLLLSSAVTAVVVYRCLLPLLLLPLLGFLDFVLVWMPLSDGAY